MIAGAVEALTLLQGAFTVDDVLDELRTNTDRLRRAVAGEPVEMRSVSLYAGVSIAPEVTVETPWGVLRAPTPVAEESWGPADAMLVSEVSGSLTVTAPGPTPRPLDAEEFRRVSAERRRQQQLTELTMLLGVDNGKPFSVQQGGTLITPLVGFGSSGYRRGATPLRKADARIDSQEAAASVAVWADRLNRLYEPRLDLVASRLISAIALRQDAGDGLIDAVIALEAMFAGTDQGELSFRIAAALAWLLEPAAPAARFAVYQRMRDIYAARSKRALARLYDHLPELLADDNRSRALILQAMNADLELQEASGE
jgi:hypothetical protein